MKIRQSSSSKKRDILSVSLDIFKSAKRAVRRKKNELSKSQRSDDCSDGGLSKDSFDTSSLSGESVGRYSTMSDGEIPMSISTEPNLEAIENQARVGLEQICSALELYTKKEEEVRTAPKYHMDRAKARLEYKNMTGAILSMRKYKKLELEYSRLDNAIQYLSMNKVSMVRLNQKIKAAMKESAESSDNASNATLASLSLQCEHMCDALIETQRIVEEDERGHDSNESMNDAQLMAELERIVYPDEAPEMQDPNETSFYEGDTDDSGDFTSTEDESDEDLQPADERLLSELSSMMSVRI